MSPYGLFGLSNPCVTHDSSSLVFYESLRVFGLSNPCVTRYSSSLMFYESLGLFGLSKPCVTRESSSLVISEFLWAVWTVESMRHPLQQFVDDF